MYVQSFYPTLVLLNKIEDSECIFTADTLIRSTRRDYETSPIRVLVYQSYLQSPDF